MQKTNKKKMIYLILAVIVLLIIIVGFALAHSVNKSIKDYYFNPDGSVKKSGDQDGTVMK